MEQLRQNYKAFVELNTEILVVGPEDADHFRTYWTKHALPFVGLPDPMHSVLDLYEQQFRLLKLGRMPAQAIIDREGKIRFVHYGDSMRDIPSPQEVLECLTRIELRNEERN